MLSNPFYKVKTKDIKPVIVPESASTDMKQDLSESFQQLREARKRKIDAKKDETNIKTEKLNEELKSSQNNAKFDWKNFLTSAPLEEENDDNPLKKYEDTFLEEIKDDFEADGTVKDVEVPENIQQEYNVNNDEFFETVKMERKPPRVRKPDINVSAWNSLYGIRPKGIADTNYTNCEFCNVKVKQANLKKHLKKCQAKLGMKMK